VALFDPAVNYVLAGEGKLAEARPSDPGGISNWGISIRLLNSLSPSRRKAYGFSHDLCVPDDVRNMTIDQAKAVYHGEFWTMASFHAIPYQDIADYVFDAAVNMGISPAVKCLQRAIWAVAEDRKLLRDDGILGEVTLGYIKMYGSRVIPAVRSERAGEYRLIAESNLAERVNLEGWLNRAYGVSPMWDK